MKIVIAPDSFKESLTADQAARAIEAGLRAVWPDADIVRVPMADGGEGTVAAITAATGGSVVPITVTGPMGEPVAAFYGLSADRRTAVIEMAAASGLELVPIAERNPLQATSYGTGELIRATLEAGVERCVIGIGGSATVDGGAGILQALGAILFDREGLPIEGMCGGALNRVARIDLTNLDSRLGGCKLEIACDVDNPLLGPTGAAAVFGPQKGATPKMVIELEQGLANFARAVADATGLEMANLPGAGAAGGAGGTLVTCLNAQLRSGVTLVAELVDLAGAIRDADLVVTGEGRLDGQSLRGKTPVGVAALAKMYQKPVIALVGSLGDGVESVYEHGIVAVFSILPRICEREEAYSHAAANLTASARNVASVWKAGADARLPRAHPSSA